MFNLSSMKIQILLAISFLTSFTLFAQKKQKEAIADSLIVHKIYDTHTIEGLDESEWAYIMSGKDTIYAHLMNENMQSISNIKVIKEKEPYTDLLGGILNQKKATLFFSDPDYTSSLRTTQETLLLTATINFSDSTAKLKEVKHLEKDDYVLHASSYKNKFYVVSVKKKSSLLKVTIFKNDSTFTNQTIYLNQFDFKKAQPLTSITSLYDVVVKGGEKHKLFFINKKLQPSIPKSSARNKVYFENDYLYISLDNEEEETKVISLNINTFKSSIKFYQFDDLYCGKYDRDNKYRTNSYIFEHALYQSKVCTNGLLLSKHTLENESIKSYKAENGSEIIFKNIPIIEAFGSWSYGRGGNKVIGTKDAFYNLFKSKTGLYATSYNDTITVTVGGFNEEFIGISGGGMTTLYGGTLLNHSVGSVQSSQKRVTYFKSLFNNSFDHIHGDFYEKGAFSAMSNYIDEENNKENVLFGDVITYYEPMNVRDFYVLSYYHKKDKRLYLKKFVNNYNSD